MFYFWVLLGVILVVVLKKWSQINYSKIPEPKRLPFIGNMIRLIGISDNVWYNIQALNKIYPIYRLSQAFISTVVICNAEDVQIFLSSKHHSEKSLVYRWFTTWLGTGLLTSSGSKWQYRRKLLTPAFHFNILQEFFEVFKEHSELFVEKLQKECEKPYIDISALLSHFTLHVICETAMGIKLNESNNGIKNYVTAIDKIGILFLRRMKRPWLFLNFLYYIFPEKREELTTLKILHDFTTSVIKDKKDSFINSDVVEYNDENKYFIPKKRLALLDLLLTLKHHGADINEEGIREEVDTFMFEGHDTTAVSLSYTFMLIANHEDVQNKILKEIEEVTNNSTKSICFQDLPKLHYLEMVLKESLRLYPSVPAIGRKTGADVFTSTGHFIPKNSYVNLQIYGIHHNEKYFPDPEKFDPDRFLPENCQRQHPYAYIPFSAGPRNCIGQRFAIMELKMVVALVVQNFKLFSIDTPSTIKFVTNLTLKTRNGVKLKIEKRI